jgi:hypothetical protein
MPNKKISQNGGKRGSAANLALVFSNDTEIDADRGPQPYRINPETTEQRERRLAKRKALTLKAFQAAYKSHKPRS